MEFDINELVTRIAMRMDGFNDCIVDSVREKFAKLYYHLLACQEEQQNRTFKVVIRTPNPVDDVVLLECEEIIRAFHRQLLLKIPWFSRVIISNCIEQSSDLIMFKVTFNAANKEAK